MTASVVSTWFGQDFYLLHPLLQDLHLKGGTLSGKVEVKTGSGLSGLLGRRLAMRLGVPKAGLHDIEVTIRHEDGALRWARCFDGLTHMISVFRPFGRTPDGYWVEHTGRIELALTVDIRNGGWYWRHLSTRLAGIPIPGWLLPRTLAYKVIEDDQYKFFVEISLPLLGTVLSYGGALTLVARPVQEAA